MAVDLSLFNNSVTYVICARVKSPDIPGGSALNWVVSPGSEQLASGLLREVMKAVEGNGDGSYQ
jgi:hypothetical protein